ncbi:MAG: L,D-transpeptidase, partial [Clostridiales bacterium]|nr:L,D-transpeptidase [Clostridiales bacterium]
MLLRRYFAFILAFFICLAAFPAVSLARDELKNTDPDRYYILLDLNNQVVTVYERDDDGAYTRVVRRFICTSGRTETDPNDPEDIGTPTPRGVWKMGGRERFGKFASFNNEYARYWTQIVGGNYFH